MMQHREATAPKSGEAAPTIEIAKPPIVSHLSTPDQRAAGTAFERVNARRIAAHNKLITHDFKVREYTNWVDSVEDLQRRIPALEAMLEASDMKLIHPSLKARLKLMRNDLDRLKKNPVKKPTAPSVQAYIVAGKPPPEKR